MLIFIFQNNKTTIPNVKKVPTILTRYQRHIKGMVKAWIVGAKSK